MAIRWVLDVYGENVRVIVPMVTGAFRIVVMVGVGAMMVGSTVITVKEGQDIQCYSNLRFHSALLFEKKYLTFDFYSSRHDYPIIRRYSASLNGRID